MSRGNIQLCMEMTAGHWKHITGSQGRLCRTDLSDRAWMKVRNSRAGAGLWKLLKTARGGKDKDAQWHDPCRSGSIRETRCGKSISGEGSSMAPTASTNKWEAEVRYKHSPYNPLRAQQPEWALTTNSDLQPKIRALIENQQPVRVSDGAHRSL